MPLVRVYEYILGVFRDYHPKTGSASFAQLLNGPFVLAATDFLLLLLLLSDDKFSHSTAVTCVLRSARD